MSATRFTATRDPTTVKGSILVTGAKAATQTWVLNQVAGHLCIKETSTQACGSCKGCLWFAEGNHLDYLSLSSSTGAIPQLKIDQVREAIHFLSFTPKFSSCRVVVVWEAEKLTLAAANAFLKTLEEPPTVCVIMLVTEYPGMLLPTIRSRCFRIRLPSGMPKTGSQVTVQQGVTERDKTVLMHFQAYWENPSCLPQTVEKLMKLFSIQEVLYSLLVVAYGIASSHADETDCSIMMWSEEGSIGLLAMRRDLGLQLWEWVDNLYEAIRGMQSGTTLNAVLLLESVLIRSQLLRKQGSRILDDKRLISYH